MSFFIAKKPKSATVLFPQSFSLLENDTFNFLGNLYVVILLIKCSFTASAYGVTSNASSTSTPDNGDIDTFLGKFPPPPRVNMSFFSASSIVSQTPSIDKLCNCIACLVVKCTLSKFCFFANSYTFLNLSILIIPDGILSLIIKSCPPR